MGGLYPPDDCVSLVLCGHKFVYHGVYSTSYIGCFSRDVRDEYVYRSRNTLALSAHYSPTGIIAVIIDFKLSCVY